MLLSSEDDEVRTWADELIDDEFTAVCSHQTIRLDTNDSKSPQKHFSLNHNNHYIYGVLTGFNYGDSNDEHCLKIFSEVFSYFPIELMERINSIKDFDQDECYENILLETFYIIEQLIRKHMDEILSEKTALELTLSGTDSSQYPKIQQKLNEYTQKLSFGFSCVITIINKVKIYVANIGDARAILCSKHNDQIRSQELSTRHDLSNPNELKRLESISIETEVLKSNQRIGNMTLTRCLGNLRLKNSYRKYCVLSTATSDPILSIPSLNSIRINSSCKFLILASASLFQTLQQCSNCENVLDDLSLMINNKLSEQNDLKNVPDLVLQDIFHKYLNLHEQQELLHSKPILLIRLFPSSPMTDDHDTDDDANHDSKAVKTVTTPIIIMNDDVNLDPSKSNDSGGNSKREPEEIDAYVDFGPLIESLKKHNIDYDSFN
uniref:TGF-beta-activated kinase 1 and MAP3K7-binding protein 1-like n=1 Tax=Dermatophagoides pteronyssinus TaxID=6956 RepID=A0A6P6YEW3_DERPT|nr:TGF-beta-activated kinase 1 and MAP3K7-binding protein 1-like [Dermatophagoides pteronyssinus]